MKKLNYTGSSKLKSRIAYLLNRKAPLPLDGNDDPDWGTNGQVLSTDGNGNTAWVNQGGGGSGGHTIWNRIKTSLTSRGKLWFADASVFDVSADDATKVEVVTELLNETAFDNLATDGTADGIYTFPDSGGEYLTAAMSSYDNTLSGLSASDVQDAIDELAQGGGSATRTLIWYEYEISCNPGSNVSNPLVTYASMSQYDEIHFEVGVGTSGASKQMGSEVVSKEMLSLLNTYGDIFYHTSNAAGIANNQFYKTGFYFYFSSGALIVGNHTQGYSYNYMRIRIEGIKYN